MPQKTLKFLKYMTKNPGYQNRYFSQINNTEAKENEYREPNDKHNVV